MNDQTLREACEALPLFPLPRVSFFPATLLPLHVFEPHFRDLVADCLAGDRPFAVPQVNTAQEASEGPAPIRTVAGVGRILRCKQLPDGRYHLILWGVGRVRIDEEPPTDTTYRVARAHLLPDVVPEQGMEDLLLQLKVVAAQLIASVPQAGPLVSEAVEKLTDPADLVHALAHIAITDPDERQAYLELDALDQRIAQTIDTMSHLIFAFNADSSGIEA